MRIKEGNMSVSMWCYEPKKCDGDYCPCDCDRCRKAGILTDEDTEYYREKYEWDLFDDIDLM